MTKIWGSALVDFTITAGTAFLALPGDSEITTRAIVTIIIGSLVATAKGYKTYHSTHPTKSEVMCAKR